MNHKEVVDALVEKFFLKTPIWQHPGGKECAKACAIICVDEIIKVYPTIQADSGELQTENERQIKYWQMVKGEIEKQ